MKVGKVGMQKGGVNKNEDFVEDRTTNYETIQEAQVVRPPQSVGGKVMLSIAPCVANTKSNRSALGDSFVLSVQQSGSANKTKCLLMRIEAIQLFN